MNATPRVALLPEAGLVLEPQLKALRRVVGLKAGERVVTDGAFRDGGNTIVGCWEAAEGSADYELDFLIALYSHPAVSGSMANGAM